MIAGVVLGCYAVAWLLTARVLYGRWRGELTRLDGFDHYCRECRSYSRSLASDHETVIRVIVAALFWPLTLMVFLVVFRPPPTAAERAAAEKKLKARIAELEREAGLTQERAAS